MPTKSFQEYIETRLTKAEIANIKRQAALEKKAIESLQRGMANLVKNYLKKEKIGFSELVRRLEVSPSHVAKIQKGEANLTLFSIARIAAELNLLPHITFTEQKK